MRRWGREAKQQRGNPLPRAFSGQTVMYFSNAWANYYSDLVHVQHIAGPGGAAPGQTVMGVSETGLL